MVDNVCHFLFKIRAQLKVWGTIHFFYFLFESFTFSLFWAEKSIHHAVAPKVKTAFQFYKELFRFRFTPQKSRINVELHAFFLTPPLHYDVERNFVPMINVELHTLYSVPFINSVQNWNYRFEFWNYRSVFKF